MRVGTAAQLAQVHDDETEYESDHEQQHVERVCDIGKPGQKIDTEIRALAV